MECEEQEENLVSCSTASQHTLCADLHNPLPALPHATGEIPATASPMFHLKIQLQTPSQSRDCAKIPKKRFTVARRDSHGLFSDTHDPFVTNSSAPLTMPLHNSARLYVSRRGQRRPCVNAASERHREERRPAGGEPGAEERERAARQERERGRRRPGRSSRAGGDARRGRPRLNEAHG